MDLGPGEKLVEARAHFQRKSAVLRKNWENHRFSKNLQKAYTPSADFCISAEIVKICAPSAHFLAFAKKRKGKGTAAFLRSKFIKTFNIVLLYKTVLLFQNLLLSLSFYILL
jgi:hypothetical protein